MILLHNRSLAPENHTFCICMVAQVNDDLVQNYRRWYSHSFYIQNMTPYARFDEHDDQIFL
jgi:hypothetical protein